MKLAILADIHSNFVALERVTNHIEAWQPDKIIVAGDVINRGPRPWECFCFVQEKAENEGWLIIRGNHEEYVFAQENSPHQSGSPEYDMYQHSRWTYHQVKDKLATIKAWPECISISAPDNSEIRITHASMRGNRDGIFSFTSDEDLREKIAPPPPLFCVGHTHIPLIRHIDETLVVNSGSVGLPFDGDTRACYAQIMWRNHQWQARMIRLNYDIEQAKRDFHDSGYMEGSGPFAHLIFDELICAKSRLYGWARRYETSVLAGEISMAESVRRSLQELARKT
ncbi:MAG: hypothetical protein B6242_01975 [Anaerolineaceae bacterium 4572_78]|nr:MAG: hypothetical protein B6242_01975 [Anaerolineaceae bacterium 4572_78]